jgi:beta-lactamase class D
VHDFRLDWPADTIVRLKTGNGSVSGERVSWLIGQLEAGGRQYVFASRKRSTSDALDTVAGANLAQRLLNTMRPRS